MEETFYYNQIIEYVDGTRDLRFEAARKWASENNAQFLEMENFERDVTVDEDIKHELVRPFQIVEMTFVEKQENVRQARANAYVNNVDDLMAEHYRKKTFNLFEDGEEAELLAKIEAKVAEIKENNPYPEENINA